MHVIDDGRQIIDDDMVQHIAIVMCMKNNRFDDVMIMMHVA